MTGCAKSEDEPGTSTSADSSAAAQTTKSAGTGGSTCTLQQFGGTKVDLKTATIGFSQSEKEANPFRIAETQSIKDEAAKLGIPAANLKMTNADSKSTTARRSRRTSSSPTAGTTRPTPRPIWASRTDLSTFCVQPGRG